MTTAVNFAELAPQLLSLYFTNSPYTLSRYAIESYDYFVTTELPQLIYNQNPITILKEPLDADKGIYAYKVEIFIGDEVESADKLGLQFGPPIITLDNTKTVRRMFPNEARLRNLTYGATVLVDVKIKVFYTQVVEGTGVGNIPATYTTRELEQVNRKSVELFKMPIMLRSVLCSTRTTESARLSSLGECQYDQGGYFIVDGAEKTLITYEEQAFNSVYAGKKPESDQKISAFASCSSLNPKNKQIRRIAMFMQRDTSAIRVSLPFVRGNIPLFIVFRALGIQSDEDIVRLIVPDPDSEEAKILEPLLIACIHDAFPITDSYLALQFIRTMTKGFVDATVQDILHNHTFTHVPNNLTAKAQFLAEMTRSLLRVASGLDADTDRDDTRNKRYLTAGSLLRELFTASWKLWRDSLVRTIDEEYNYNRSVYRGENFARLFSDGNLPRILNSRGLNDSMMRGFRGKWGTDSRNEKKGVIQPLARISYLDSMSHVRRVSLDFELKSPGPRRLHPSQCGYFCIAEVPSGFSIGLTKNASIMTFFSLAEDTKPLENWLLQKGGITQIDKSTPFIRKNFCKTQINGGTIGFIKNPEILLQVLKLLKNTGCLAPTTSISFNRQSRTVRIFMDEGRPCRPLYILRQGTPSPLLDRLAEVNWRDLIRGLLPATRDRALYEVGFVDPFPAERDLTRYLAELTPFSGALEYVDPYEANESFISWYGDAITPEHTHVEIHPSTLFGFVGNMIPFANHNQSPRNQLSCSQSKQGIGYYNTQFHQRFDTYSQMLCYGEAPIARTVYYDYIADGSMPYGTNCIVALASFDGYNMDDGILFNASSIERGLFRHLSFRTYDAAEEKDPLSNSVTKIGNPSKVSNWISLRPGLDYSKLDENGIIKEGEYIDDTTVLVGRYVSFPDTGQIKDASTTPAVFSKGRVEKVVVIHQADGFRLVKIRIFEMRVPELGDKFSTRHGQKGTIGMIRPAYDLPRTTSGLVPDILVNPHCIPSRMTVAQILEQITSKVGAVAGAKMNSTSFTNDERHHEIMGEALQEAGFERHGEEMMYSGMTGKQYQSTLFICPLYFMRLRHLTEDKINARSVGRKEVRTHQPTGGRGNEGGLRIGEMERDVLIAHGISQMLHERMMKCSDETTFTICNSCGQMPIYNKAENLYVCTSCDGPVQFTGSTAETLTLVKPITRSRATFSDVTMPYAFKLLNQEVSTYLNAGLRLVTESSAARLRHEDLDWIAVAGMEDARMKMVPLPAFEPEPLPTSTVQESALAEVEAPAPQVEVVEEGARAEEAVITPPAAQPIEQEGNDAFDTVQITLPDSNAPPSGSEPQQRGGGGERPQNNVIIILPKKNAGRPRGTSRKQIGGSHDSESINVSPETTVTSFAETHSAIEENKGSSVIQVQKLGSDGETEKIDD